MNSYRQHSREQSIDDSFTDSKYFQAQQNESTIHESFQQRPKEIEEEKFNFRQPLV
jgi:hypothetical protein